MISDSAVSPPELPRIEDEIAALRQEVRRWLWRVLLGTVLLVPLAWIVFSPAISRNVGMWAGLLLATPVYGAIGWPLAASGLRRFRAAAHRGDLLLAAGVTIAYGAGLWQFSQFTRQVFEKPELSPVQYGSLFVDAMLILTFIALGKYLQAVALDQFVAPLGALLDLAPEAVTCVREGQSVEVAVHSVPAGETILIRPAQRVPLDVRVLSGTSQADVSWLTGDPRPVDVGPDSEIAAGALNGAGPLIAQVVRTSRESAPQRVVALLRRGEMPVPKRWRWIDPLATWSVPAVALAAMMAAGFWFLRSPWEEAIAIAIALLLAPSMSALALSVVTALQAGSSRGAQMGVLLASASAVETAAGLVAVAIDKSAAITPGLPAVAELITHAGVRPEELLATAAAAAQFGDDALSRCIVQEARRRGLRVPGARSHQVIPDCGILARMLTGEALLGTAPWASDMHVNTVALTGKLAALTAAGRSAAVVAVGTRLFGIVAAADVVAPYSRQAVGQLRAMGLRAVLLSTDSAAVTGAASREVAFDEVLCEVHRNDLADLVSSLRNKRQPLALVGSGQDDAAALAAADLGIVLERGAHVDVEGAAIVLPGDLRGIGRAILLSRAIASTLQVNVLIAVAYNLIALPLAATGVLPSPGVLAAAGTTAASMAVVGSSLMLMKRRID